MDLIGLHQALTTNYLDKLARSSLPFESNYMTAGSYLENPVVLPPWALQALCEKFNETAAGVTITGDMDKLIYTMKMKGVTIEVDWGTTLNNEYSAEELSKSGMPELIAAILAAQQSIWGEGLL